MTAPALDLTGTWKLTLRVANRAAIPLLGDTTVWSVSTYLATVRWDGEQFIQHHVVCDIETRSTRRIAEHVLPLAYVRAMPEKTYPLGLTPDGDTLGFHADLALIHIGYDPLATGGSLPVEDQDNGLIEDWDGDGHPGATVRLKVPVLGVVEVYMVQRMHALIAGVVSSPDLIYGQLALPIVEQRIVGASNVLMRGNPRVEPDPDNSSFRMVRLPQGTTCAELGLPKPRPTDF